MESDFDTHDTASEADHAGARKDRHLWKKVHVRLSDKDIEALDEIVALAGKKGTRSDVLRKMIHGARLFRQAPDPDIKRCLSELKRIGGLMKHYKIGTREDVDRLFDEVKKLARIIYAQYPA